MHMHCFSFNFPKLLAVSLVYHRVCLYHMILWLLTRILTHKAAVAKGLGASAEGPDAAELEEKRVRSLMSNFSESGALVWVSLCTSTVVQFPLPLFSLYLHRSLL